MFKKKSFLGIAFVCLSMLLHGQDTFSIVAIDSVTGEIGSAGASCVGSSTYYPHGAAVLSDVIPGIGAIHTQAAYLEGNQDYAHELMMQGLPPQQIIDSLLAHDAGGNNKTRQYGIVDYNNGHPRSASYTGINCQNYKNDTNNIYYSIQGNILLGQLVLDSMQARFLNTQGSLADRLMATLQGAKIVGADTRCAPKNSSSQSSFIRVARPTDPYDTLYCDLYMAYPQTYQGVFPVDPIDSLQTLFDLWKSTTTNIADKKIGIPVKVWSASGGEVIFDFTGLQDYQDYMINIFDLTGRMLFKSRVNGRTMSIHPFNSSFTGICFYQVLNQNQLVVSRGKILVK
jgi:uncharacterized Ntn-hydrolase superfamily protein